MKPHDRKVPLIAAILAFAVTLALVPSSCADRFAEGAAEAGAIAAAMDAKTVAIRRGLLGVAEKGLEILSNPGAYASDLFPGRSFEFFKETVYHTPKDDGHGTLFSTGFVPVGPKEKARLKALEHLSPHQKAFVESGPAGGLVSQTYFITADSLFAFYPYADLLSYIPPKRDIRTRGIWLRFTEGPQSGAAYHWAAPYVDTTGKGYVVDVTCPVRSGGEFVAVAGADITLNALEAGLAARDDLNLILVEPASTQIIALSAAAERLFKVDNADAFKYLRMIESNTGLDSPVM
ncbi:MAG: hypothetical protein JNG85_17775, partial [Spirochaetaceae bacterium]|nr:hypothetical protein [Spirochaetaceae bacterium]